MNGIHEVTGSIPVRSTNLRSRDYAEVARRSLDYSFDTWLSYQWGPSGDTPL